MTRFEDPPLLMNKGWRQLAVDRVVTQDNDKKEQANFGDFNRTNFIFLVIGHGRQERLKLIRSKIE